MRAALEAASAKRGARRTLGDGRERELIGCASSGSQAQDERGIWRRPIRGHQWPLPLVRVSRVHRRPPVSRMHRMWLGAR